MIETGTTSHNDAIPRVDMDGILASVNETSAGVRNSWIAFMGLTAFFFIAIASVTHKDLLLNSDVTLPLLQVSISLDRFFLFGPLVYIFIHFGVLLHHVLLAQKAEIFDTYASARESLSNQKPDTIRYQLHSYFLTQVVAGPVRYRPLGRYLGDLSWISLTILPVMLLLFFQFSFLPYHDSFTTWAHRGYLIMDALIIFVLGTYLASPLRGFFFALLDSLRYYFFRTIASWIFLGFALVLSLFVATIPGENLERGASFLNSLVPASLKSERYKDSFFLSYWLFEGKVNPLTGHNSAWFKRNLIVTDADLRAEKEARSGDKLLSFRGRDLRYATFDRSNLTSADFAGAKMQSSSLIGAVLDKTNLAGANLQGSFFWKPGLEDTESIPASLKKADLRRANLEGVNFQGARLEGADLSSAKLNGAVFITADAKGANFTGAELIGANFTGAQLHASIFNAAKLYGATFQNAALPGASLTGAYLMGINFKDADLTATDLRQGTFWLLKSSRRFHLTDARFRKLLAPRKSELDWIKSVLLKLPADLRNRINTRLHNLFNTRDISQWQKSRDYRIWKGLIASIPVQNDKDYKQNLTKTLTSLACSETNPDATIATSLLKRASRTTVFTPQFNGDLGLFYIHLNDYAACKDSFSHVPFKVRQSFIDLARAKSNYQEIREQLKKKRREQQDEKLNALQALLHGPEDAEAQPAEEGDITAPKEPEVNDVIAKADADIAKERQLQAAKAKQKAAQAAKPRTRTRKRRRYRRRR